MRIISITSLLLMASVAGAADNGIYLGGGVVRSSIDASSGDIANTLNNSDLDDDDNGFKAIVGIRPLDWLAAEVNYIDLGEVSASSGTIDAAIGIKGIDAFALLLFGRPSWISTPRAAFQWDAEFESAATAVAPAMTRVRYRVWSRCSIALGQLCHETRIRTLRDRGYGRNIRADPWRHLDILLIVIV